MLEQLDLSQSALGQNLLGEDICNLLNRNTFLGLSVCCGARLDWSVQPYHTIATTNIPDNAVCSLSQFLGDRVSLVDDKVLVEDLEHLSSL